MLRITRRFFRPAGLAALAVFCAAPSAVAAQTTNQLAAWYGLMLSPIGAVAPMTHDPALAGVPGSTLSARYGRWRYDADDAVHDNMGLTWTRRFAFLQTELAVTGGYQLDECGACSGWQVAGVSLRSTVVRLVSSAEPMQRWRFGIGAVVDAGGAKYHGTGGATTFSLAGALPLELSFPLPWTSSLRVAAIPGIGYGRISADSRANSGILGTFGGAIGWAITSRAVLDIGLQRVIMPRSVPQVGAAFSWQYRGNKAGK